MENNVSEEIGQRKKKSLFVTDKKSFIYLIVVLAVFLIVALISFLARKPMPSLKEEKPSPPEKTLEEVIQDLTAPMGEDLSPEVPEKIIQNLTAPQNNYQVEEKIIQELTAPE